MIWSPFAGGLNGDDPIPHEDADFSETTDDSSWADVPVHDAEDVDYDEYDTDDSEFWDDEEDDYLDYDWDY